MKAARVHPPQELDSARSWGRLDAYGNLPHPPIMAPPSGTVVAAAHEAACRTIEAADVVLLSMEDQERIAKAVLKSPAPAPALRRAFRRRRALLGRA